MGATILGDTKAEVSGKARGAALGKVPNGCLHNTSSCHLQRPYHQGLVESRAIILGVTKALVKVGAAILGAAHTKLGRTWVPWLRPWPKMLALPKERGSKWALGGPSTYFFPHR